MSEEIKNTETTVTEEANNGDVNHVEQKTEKTFSQSELDEIVKSRLSRAESKFKKDFQNSEEFKAYARWKDEKKTEEERVQETLENYSALKNDYDKLASELNSYRNKDVLRGKEIEAKYVDFVNFEVEKMVNEETDYNAALEKYLEANPQYTKDKDAAKITTGQRHPVSNNDLDDLDKLRKQMGVPLKEGK